MEQDAVDVILDQWRRERPDLDISAMGPIGRLKRCAALVERQLAETFARFGLASWEFDVLATLRRSGAPYSLAPTVLFSSLMVTSSTMTHRMHQLSQKGWVSRAASSQDARSTLVQLTPVGLELIDKVLEAHVANETALVAGLKPAELAALDRRLSKLLISLEK